MRHPREKLLMRRGTRWQRGVILLKKKIPVGIRIRENMWAKMTKRKTTMRRKENLSRTRPPRRILVRIRRSPRRRMTLLNER